MAPPAAQKKGRSPPQKAGATSTSQLHLCPSLGGQHGQFKKFAEAGVDPCAGVREDRVANDFVGGVELQLAVFDKVDQERGEVARVHLTGVIGHGAGEIEPADDGDAVDADFFSGLGELAIAAAFRSEIDDYGTRRHAGDHFFGDQHRRGLAGNHGGGDDHVAFGDHFAEQLALLAVKIFTLRARVAAFVLRVFGFDGQFDEAASEALHLLLNRRAQIVGGNHRAQAARGSDGLQSRDAAADDQHARGSDGARRGGEHGKNFGQRVRGNERRFVSGNGGHGGERVHALRARGARHQLDGEGGDSFAGDFGDGFDGAERAKKTDEHLVAMKQRKVGLAGAVVGAVAKNLRDDIGGAKHFRAIRQDFRALGGVIGVRITGFDTRTSLNDDFQARLGQRGQYRGHQRHAPLPRKRFAGNTDNHEPSITSFHKRPKEYR